MTQYGWKNKKIALVLSMQPVKSFSIFATWESALTTLPDRPSRKVPAFFLPSFGTIKKCLR
jgi:hypothetical protein